ncbi:MAG: formylglycine-generating enzyme family protein [Deltaproteobacteria bacterium]|nr:formylglycine-generating enzyme family protein [Deltaproteobacteria bacterium]
MSIIMGADLAGMGAANFATLAPSLVTLPGGTFTMGGRDFEDTNPHEVTVSAFKMGRNPVTNDAYGTFVVDSLKTNRFALIGSHVQTGEEKLLALGGSMGEIRTAAGSVLDSLFSQDEEMAIGGSRILMGALKMVHIPDHNPPANFDRPQQPAVNVSWYGAFVYAALHNVRLLREAEFEYAARVVQGERKLHDYATPSGKMKKEEAHFDAGATIEVDDPKYPTLANGLRHLMGQVWEWQGDWYGGYPNGSVTDPIGPAHGQYKVLRGGSWINNVPDYLRASYRYGFVPEDRLYVIGFRVASSLSASPQD